MIRRPPRSTPLYSSAASDVYKRQGYGARDDDQARDASGRSRDHHSLDLAYSPFAAGPSTHFEVSRQVRAGRHVDEGVDTAQTPGQLGRVQVSQSPVHPVGTPTLGTKPYHGANGTPSSGTRQQRTRDAIAHRCRRTGYCDGHRCSPGTNPYPGGTHWDLLMFTY